MIVFQKVLIILFIVFFIINIWIIRYDTVHRRIPNKLLLFLLILLPIWLYSTLGSINQIFMLIFISSMCILGGVLLRKGEENEFLGSGDIKYMALLVLFLGTSSFSQFIGNIGVLTLCVLLLWGLIILGHIYMLHISLGDIKKQLFHQKIIPNIIVENTIMFIGDWIIIGFFLSLVIKEITVQIFQIISSNGDHYFLLSLIIFLIRPGLRYILTKGQYRIYPIIGILLYFGRNIQSYGWEAFGIEYSLFISNIWQYILIFTLVQYITKKIFSIYDALIKRLEIGSFMHTVPYSVIIFGAFCLTYFFDINLMGIIRNNLF